VTIVTEEKVGKARERVVAEAEASPTSLASPMPLRAKAKAKAEVKAANHDLDHRVGTNQRLPVLSLLRACVITALNAGTYMIKGRRRETTRLLERLPHPLQLKLILSQRGDNEASPRLNLVLLLLCLLARWPLRYSLVLVDHRCPVTF
jgi:hypothetical protein